MEEFYVFDLEFNLLGIIDVYEDVTGTTNYDDHSDLTLTVEGTKEMVDLLFCQSENDGRIIAKASDLTRGYLVTIPQFDDGATTKIIVSAKSLSIITNWRIIPSQQVFNGNVEDVIKSFVNTNCINPKEANRKIPNLVLAENQGIDIVVEEAYTEIELDIALWEMCNKHEMSFEILMDHGNKQYVFKTFKGIDRTTQQEENDWVTFSKEFGNVISQSYIDDRSNERTTAVVIGNYEDLYEMVVSVNDNLSGFARREYFVDARDIESIWTNEDDVDISMTEQQYEKVLREHGISRITEYRRIQTLESDIDFESQYQFGKDFFLGDKVSSVNDELGIIMHRRVVQTTEVYNKAGYSLSLQHGEPILEFVDKVKRELKK